MLTIKPERFDAFYRSLLKKETISKISREDCEGFALPLAGLIWEQWQRHHDAQNMLQKRFPQDTFYDEPYVLGVTGPIAVGKSFVAKNLQKILTVLLPERRVVILSMDHFLYPTKVLKEKNLFGEKGSPATYDYANLVRVLKQFRQKNYPISIPFYCHTVYDTCQDGETFDGGDIVIFDGLHVLHIGEKGALSDFCHLSVFIDAPLTMLKHWYQERFASLVACADDGAHYASYKNHTPQEIEAKSSDIWERINLPNIKRHILPFRERADVLCVKGQEHRLKSVALRL